MESLSRHPEIILVEAAVHEEQAYHEQHTRSDHDERRSHSAVVRTPPGAMQLGLRIVLSAVLGDGRRVTAENCFGIGGHPDMLLSEVNELIDRLLGRDPDLRRPPRLAWEPIMSALEGIGVTSSESQLIATPLEVRLEPSAYQVITFG